MIEKAGDGKTRVKDPIWESIREHFFFVMAHQEDNENPNALMSLWQPPFMAEMHGGDIPRILICVGSHSDLIEELIEIERGYHLGD